MNYRVFKNSISETLCKSCSNIDMTLIYGFYINFRKSDFIRRPAFDNTVRIARAGGSVTFDFRKTLSTRRSGGYIERTN